MGVIASARGWTKPTLFGQRTWPPPPRQMAHACVAICSTAWLRPRVAFAGALLMAVLIAGTS
eukprot:10184788-Prorocentrum_lima.AAC.1